MPHDTHAAARAETTVASLRPIAVEQTPPRHRKFSPWLLVGGTTAVLMLAGTGAYLMTAARMEITEVSGPNVLVGNGRPQATQLRYSARAVDIRAIEVRLLRGDGSHTPPSWSVPVDGATREIGSLSAGTLSPVAATPQRLTFEYILVDRDGRRSAPFEKTFDVVPPSRITQVQAPPRVTVGQPLNVALGYQRGSSDIVKVQRRVVESDVPWDAPEQTYLVQLNQAQGTHELRLDVPARAQRSTVELTLIDAAGIPSEPQRLSFSAGAAAPAMAFATVLNVTQLGGASGLGAVGGAVAGGALGNRFGRGGGRTAMTALGAIGGAVAGHQIEQNMRGPSEWETTVQMDGGQVRRLRHSTPPRWQAGARVRIAGNVIQG